MDEFKETADVKDNWANSKQPTALAGLYVNVGVSETWAFQSKSHSEVHRPEEWNLKKGKIENQSGFIS